MYPKPVYDLGILVLQTGAKRARTQGQNTFVSSISLRLPKDRCVATHETDQREELQNRVSVKRR